MATDPSMIELQPSLSIMGQVCKPEYRQNKYLHSQGNVGGRITEQSMNQSHKNIDVGQPRVAISVKWEGQSKFPEFGCKLFCSISLEVQLLVKQLTLPIIMNKLQFVFIFCALYIFQCIQKVVLKYLGIQQCLY